MKWGNHMVPYLISSRIQKRINTSLTHKMINSLSHRSVNFLTATRRQSFVFRCVNIRVIQHQFLPRWYMSARVFTQNWKKRTKRPTCHNRVDSKVSYPWRSRCDANGRRTRSTVRTVRDMTRPWCAAGNGRWLVDSTCHITPLPPLKHTGPESI